MCMRKFLAVFSLCFLPLIPVFGQNFDGIIMTSVQDLVDYYKSGSFRIEAVFYESLEKKNLVFSVEDEGYVIPVRLVRKDLGAVDRFLSLDLHKGDTLVIEGVLSEIPVRSESYKGLVDATICDVRKHQVRELDQKPSFMGGDMNEFSEWVNSKLVYPRVARKNGVQGRVVLRFTVEADGRVDSVKVLRGVDKSLDKEAVRVVLKSPRWTPGYLDGKPVGVTYIFPVVFQLRLF